MKGLMTTHQPENKQTNNSSVIYTESGFMSAKQPGNEQTNASNGITLLTTVQSRLRDQENNKKHKFSRSFIQPSGHIKTENNTAVKENLILSRSNQIPLLLKTNTSQENVPARTMQFLPFTLDDLLLSTKSQADEPCSPQFITSTNATAGVVTWIFNYSSCVQDHTWLFVFSKGYGCIVEFHHVDMQLKDTLQVIDSDHSINITRRTFTQSNNESLAPAILHMGTLMIKVSTSLKRRSTRARSRFNISFTTQLHKSLPMSITFFDNKPRESITEYICTGINPIPKAFMCDGVRHCQYGKDEQGCAYRQAGCGDWFPYDDHCLKAKFISAPDLSCGYAMTFSPLKAERVCRTEYNATLALLPDVSGIQIAASMIRKSGFIRAIVGIRKVRPVSMKIKQLYRFLWQWGDRGSPIAYEQQELQRSGVMENCGLLSVSPSPSIQPARCDRPIHERQGHICMRLNPNRSVQVKKTHNVTFHRTSALTYRFPTKECPDGSLVQVFHRCQWREHDTNTSMGWSPGNLPLFQCRFGPAIHYSLLCDGKDDCVDHSDEMLCQKPRYSPLLASSFICTSLQTIAVEKRCNGIADCFDNSDEEFCTSCYSVTFCPGVGCIPSYSTHLFDTCPVGPPSRKFLPTEYRTGSVHLDGYGLSILKPVTENCSEGFYQCLNGFCIPAFLMNNGEKDCFHGEDETFPAHIITCPGYYRCQGVGSCIHKNYVCDGIYHCPSKDDEMFCHLTCPHDRGCVCEGQAFTCSNMIDPFQHLHVHYLDLSHASNVSVKNIHVMEYLAFLNLSSCHLNNVNLRDMPMLQILDLSLNSFTELVSLHFHILSGLVFLDLSNNPVGRTLSSAFTSLLKTGKLENLRNLILVNVSLEEIADRVFSPLANLQHLDIHHNLLHNYNQESLYGLQALEVLYTDQSKLCCDYFHPPLLHCYAPVDELSSCDDLLAQNFFRVCLWILSVLAIAGNSVVLIYRLFIYKRDSAPASHILLKNLCVSDCLMGVYMIIIGIADAQFQGKYVAKEFQWTSSVACTIAGFLSLVSSEVSAFLICLITLDRVLVMCFPFNYQHHLGSRATIVACCLVWIIGITIATVPILAGMEFYGLNSICLPLPITQQQFSGQAYAFGIFIIFNFVIFLFIGIGQVLIYRAIQNTRKEAGSQRRYKDIVIARRLFLVVFTDFCCWFPVGVMGLLAFRGIPIPGWLNVWTAIFVLPLNSALNPFLYTINSLLEEWKKTQDGGEGKDNAGQISNTDCQMAPISRATAGKSMHSVKEGG